MASYKLARYNNSSVIFNWDFSELEDCSAIPNSILSAKCFDSRTDLKNFMHYEQVNHSIMIKCAFENGVHNGTTKRKVPKFGLYGHFSDGTPFIVQDLKLYGFGHNMYFRAIKEVVEERRYVSEKWKLNKDGERYETVKREFPSRKRKVYFDKHGDKVTQYRQADTFTVPVREHREEFFYAVPKWKPCIIKVNSTLGQFINWFTEMEYPEPIPVIETDIKANDTIEFQDKRPRHKIKPLPVPNGTHSGVTFK